MLGYFSFSLIINGVSDTLKFIMSGEPAAVPDIAADAVLVPSDEMPAGAEKVQVILIVCINLLKKENKSKIFCF